MGKIYTIDEIKEKIKPIAEKYGIETVWLFGSYARGEADENSDVDLLINYKSGLGLKFVGFVADLEDALGVHVDVLTNCGLYQSPPSKTKNSMINNVERDRRLLLGY